MQYVVNTHHVHSLRILLFCHTFYMIKTHFKNYECIWLSIVRLFIAHQKTLCEIKTLYILRSKLTSALFTQCINKAVQTLDKSCMYGLYPYQHSNKMIIFSLFLNRTANTAEQSDYQWKIKCRSWGSITSTANICMYQSFHKTRERFLDTLHEQITSRVDNCQAY